MKHPKHASARLPGGGATLPQLLLQRGTKDAVVLAQRCKRRGVWQRLSWGDVLANVRGYANGLSARGVVRGATVAVLGENEPEHFFAELAIQSLGGICVSLYPDMTKEELQFILDHSEAVAIFAQDQEQTDKVLEVLDSLPKIGSIIYWDDSGMWSYRHPLLLDVEALKALGESRNSDEPEAFEATIAAGRPSDTAVILYTSGTTGRPKGVVCSHAFLIDNASRIAAGSGTKPGMEYLSYVPLAWALEQFLGMTLGILQPLVVNFSERPESILSDLREINVEVIFFGPRQWESLASSIQTHMFDAGRVRRGIYDLGMKIGRLTNLARLGGTEAPMWARLAAPLAERMLLRPLRDKLGLVRVKSALCSGAAMAPDAFRLFHTLGVPLRNAYGGTEFGLIAIHQGETFDLETSGSVIPVEPEFGNKISWQIAENGELRVRGGTGFVCYLKQDDKTAERRDGEWYRTGDYCAEAPNGDIVFMDRLDDLRKLADGQSYPPQYIESRLRFSPFIKEVMSVGDDDRHHVAALIEIDGEVVAQWADDRKIGFSGFSDLSQHAAVRDLIKSEIASVNRLLPKGSRVKAFANFPKPLDPDEGELTRTRKLRRSLLAERYAPLIEELYGTSGSVNLEVPIRYQDGKRGVLKSLVFVEPVEERWRNEGQSEVASGTRTLAQAS